MFIQNAPISPSFTSYNSPIMAETIVSKLGKVTIKEVSTKNELVEVAKLFRRQQGLSYNKSLWGVGRTKIKESRREYGSINKNEWLKDIKNYLLNLLKKEDGNTTILVAKDEEKDKIIGFATMESVDGAKTPTGIIKDYYVDYKYRQEMNVGDHMLRALTKSSRGFFDRIISKQHAWGNYVYEDLGYRQMDDAEEKKLNRKYAEEDYQVWFEKDLG